MRRVKFQEGGQARSGINNEPVGQNFRRLLERMTAPSARSEAPAQGPRPQSGQRPQEDRARMAAEAAAQFDAEEQALRDRAAARREARGGTRITNEPVGQRLFGGRPSAPAPRPAPREMSAEERQAFMERTMREEDDRTAAARQSAQRPNRPAARPAPRRPAQREMSAEERQAFMERVMREEADREAAARQPERGFFERLGLRRTNETGMEPGTIEHRRNYLGSGATDTNTSYNKKGGLIKAKAPAKKTAMKKGGVVKKAAGGKVAAPKKMMKGGMTSKPKKMMGGGKAMYAKGGMAKGCK